MSKTKRKDVDYHKQSRQQQREIARVELAVKRKELAEMKAPRSTAKAYRG